MIKFNLKLVIRTLIRQKVYSVINLIGLSVGLAGTFILLLYVSTELRYDKYNKNLNSIFRINQFRSSTGDIASTTPYVLATTLRSDIPETFKIARYFNIGNTKVESGDINFYEPAVYCSDNDLFSILSFVVLEGKQETFLKDPNSVVLTKSVAHKYFGNISPIGLILKIENNGDSYSLTVTGIIKDLPSTSTLKMDIITNTDIALKQLDKLVMSTGNKKWGPDYYAANWSLSFFFSTLVLIPENYKPEYLEKIMAGYEGKHYEKDPSGLKFVMQPYKEIYFQSKQIKGNGDTAQGNSRTIYIYSIVAVLIILTASFNYILLSTSKAEQRIKEFGLRVSSGASRLLILRQILGETVFISLLALPFGLSITELVLPWVSMPLFNKLLSINYIENWRFTIGLIIITLIIGIVSGAYLALKILRSNPVEILKRNALTRTGKSLFTKVLNIAQLSISKVLIICTGVIYSQLRFFTSSDLGFDTKHIVTISLSEDGVRQNYNAIKNKIKSSPLVANVTGSMWAIPNRSTMGIGLPRVDDRSKIVNTEGLMVDYNFASTLGLKIIEGRDFSEDMGSEEGKLIISKSSVKELGITNPIGTKLSFGSVIGVVEDFHLHSFREKMPPMLILFNPQGVRRLIVKLSTDDLPGSIRFLESVWKEYAGSKPFEYTLLDDSLKELYMEDNRFGKTLMVFSCLTLFIALLGIFGMSMINAEKKTKEIGIRKVMGASPIIIFKKLISEYLLLVMISVSIAFPVSYILMAKWLQNFEYHNAIKLWIFLVAAFASVVLVLFTSWYQVNKSANSNPVDTLKYE